MLNPISNIFQKKYGKHGLMNRISQAVFIEAVKKILVDLLGHEQMYAITALYIKDDTLFIQCANSVLVQEVTMLKPRIIEELNAALESGTVPFKKIQVTS